MPKRIIMSEHRSFPKPPTRLVERTAKRREAMQAWLACCAAVDARDKWICRCCGRRTKRTLTLCAERLEHHHLVGRRIAPGLTHDSRNVIDCCLECHGKLHRHELHIEGRAEEMFTHDGRRFWNADCPLHIIQVEMPA